MLPLPSSFHVLYLHSLRLAAPGPAICGRVRALCALHSCPDHYHTTPEPSLLSTNDEDDHDDDKKQDRLHNHDGGETRIISQRDLDRFTGRRVQYVALHNGCVQAWWRFEVVTHFQGRHPRVLGMLVFGDKLIAWSSTHISSWTRSTGERVQIIPFSGDGGGISCATHPPTFVNKVLIGTTEGYIYLVNVNTGAVVHRFVACTGGGSPVTCLAPSPHADVVAAGFHSGRIGLIDLRADELLLEFNHADRGPVASLSFLSGTDPRSVAPPTGILVSGCAGPRGDLVIWDLENGLLRGVVEHAHPGGVSQVSFLPGSTTLVSTGADNSLRLWALDCADGLCRLVKERRGHPLEVTPFVRYDDQGAQFVTCSRDARGTSCFVGLTRLDRSCVLQELAQRKTLKRQNPEMDFVLPPVTAVSCAFSRHYDWPNIVTLHQDSHEARIWSGFSKSLDGKRLAIPDRASVPTSALDVSPCGNYVVIGYINGELHRFNLQSATHHGAFANRVDHKERPAHAGPVCGTHVLASQIVVSASKMNFPVVKLWRLATRELLEEVEVGYAREEVQRIHAQGALVAVALHDAAADSMALTVVDLMAKKVVRRFAIAVAELTGIQFSPDGRWLVAAGCDGGVRVFELLAARLVDWLQLDNGVAGLSFASEGRLLITASQRGGLRVWRNRQLLEPDAEVTLEEVTAPTLFDAASGSTDMALAPDPPREDLGGLENSAYRAEEDTAALILPLEEGAITLSGLGGGRLQSILYLEELRQKSKPEVLTAPAEQRAPFILDQLSLSDLGRVREENDDVSTAAPSPANSSNESTRSALKSNLFLSPLQKMLREEPLPCQAMLEYLVDLTPSKLHVALQDIGPLAGSTEREFERMLQFFSHHVTRRHQIDFIQALLSLFLQFHAEAMISDDANGLSSRSAALMEGITAQLSGDWLALEQDFQQLTCTIKYLAQLQMDI